MIRKLRIDPDLIVQAPTTTGHKNYGKESFLAHSEELERVLFDRYARPRLCLKVFKELGPRQIKHPEKFKWGGALLTDCTRAQNIFAMYGIAPRVYDVVVLNGKRLAQVCDYADGDGEPDVRRAQEIVKQYKLGCAGYKDRRKAALRYVALPFKWVGDKFVDLGRFHMTNRAWYKANLKARIQHRPRGRMRSLVGYQSLPAWGVPGQRKASHRLRHMRLDDYNFAGKTVLDLGCSLGRFCREALDRGAKRVVGVDCYHSGLWRQVNSYLGYWNIDFLRLRLPDQWKAIEERTGIKQFDVVFALAIVQHMKGGYGKWIAALTREVLWLEGGLQNARSFKKKDLRRDFPRVQFLGYVRDEDKRHLYRCWKTARQKSNMLPLLPKERREAAIKRGMGISGRVMLYPETLGFVYDMAKQAPAGAAVEIGAMDGSALSCWAAARMGRGRMYAIEIADRPELRANIAHYGYQVEALQVASEAAGDIIPEEIAFLFIDGDHSFTGVAKDIELYVPRIRPGGIVVFHDYAEGKHDGVRLAVNAWSRDAKWDVIGTCRSAIAFRGPQ